MTKPDKLKIRPKDAATIAIATAAIWLLVLISDPSIVGLKSFGLILILTTVVHLGSSVIWKLEDILAKAAKSRISIFLVGAAGFAIVASLCVFGKFPQPDSHDEFSYLLAADTYAHGRLTNLTHPMWVHFETFHVIQTPSYASKYPPAQGIILAIGQLLSNDMIGVWLSTALLCAALFWMLKQWIPPKWALVGAAVACLHPELLYWGHGFWGGQLAMTGGCMLLGSFKRALSSATLRDGLIAGIGCALMANTRPFEGALLTIIVACSLLFSIKVRKISQPRQDWLRLAAAYAAVLVLTGFFIAFYNHRVTGNWHTLPYMVHEIQYEPIPLFWWQKMRPIPHFNHPEFYDMRLISDKRAYDLAQSFPLAMLWAKVKAYLHWYLLSFDLPILLLVSLPLLLKRDFYMRLAVAIILFFYIGPFAETWANGSHYFAPAAGLFFLVPLQAMRHWRVWRWKGLRPGLPLMRAVVIITFLLLANSFRTGIQELRGKQSNWSYQRADLIQSLERQGGQHLVVVHYLPGHSPVQQWIYNGADIDNSPVVWAHDMGVEKNKELLDYFKDRHVWLLTLGPASGSFVPYTEAAEASLPPREKAPN